MNTHKKPRTLLALALALLALSALQPFSLSALSADTLAFERAAHLRNGVNLSHWFAQEKAGSYSVQRLRNAVTTDDLRLIKTLGLDHVRLPVDAPQLYKWQAKDAAGLAYMTELDRAVKEITQLNLAVIIDIHSGNEFNNKLQQAGLNGDATKKFLALWGDLAAHYAQTDPKLVFFEILNEPHMTNQDFNWNLHKLAAGKIRAAAPAHTIIACCGSRKADISGLLDIKQLLPFPNIIYTFHNYKPDAFSHQGAGWVDWAPYKEFRYVPYPSTPENVTKALAQVTSDKAKKIIKQYGDERWDGARIDGEVFTPARKWCERNGVPAYVGEYGVLGGKVDPAMRAQCIHDMRAAINKNNLYGALWDYQTNFGLVTKTKGAKAVPDPAIVKALGLTLPAE